MNAQEIRAERAKHIAWFDEFKDKCALLENLLFMQYLAHLEIAAQLAELNERDARRPPTHRADDDGSPAWKCNLCGIWVYSEAHFKQHVHEHEERNKKTGGAR